VATTEAQRVVEKFYEVVINGGHLERLAEFVGEDYKDLSTDPDKILGVSGLHERLQLNRVHFNGFRLTVADLLAQDDRVSVRASIKATTQNGDVLERTGMDILRVVNGRIVERWGTW
jgi:predicted SnoaL-like aldol condensation-catalyzing enzyme